MQLKHALFGALLLASGAVWASGGSQLLVPVTNGAAAAAGVVGEIAKACVTAASGPTASSGIGLNVAAVALSAGDWDVTGNCELNGTLTGTAWQCGVTATSGTIPAAGFKGDTWVELPTMPTANSDAGAHVGDIVQNVSSTTTVYLVERVFFSAGTAKVYGCISARRRR